MGTLHLSICFFITHFLPNIFGVYNIPAEVFLFPCLSVEEHGPLHSHRANASIPRARDNRLENSSNRRYMGPSSATAQPPHFY